MIRTNVRFPLIALFGFAFACLFLSGAPRLIESEERPGEGPVLHDSRPIACIVSAAKTVGEPEAKQSGRAQTQRLEASAEESPTQPDALLAGRLDANGNVLRGDSYLHAVYLVFVSGDGFA